MQEDSDTKLKTAQLTITSKKDDFHSVLRTFLRFYIFFVLIHVQHHVM